MLVRLTNIERLATWTHKLYVLTEISEVQSEPDECAKYLVLYLVLRGKVIEEYVLALNKLKAPNKPILTLHKLNTILLTLKVQVHKLFQSLIVYKSNRPTSIDVIQGTLSVIQTIWQAHPTLWSVPIIRRQG